MADYLIIGNGVAANSAAQSIRRLDSQGPIIMFTKERFPFYYTPALPEYLAGEKSLKNIIIHDASWYERNRIDVHLGLRVAAIDTASKVVVTENDGRFTFQRLLLATGGTAQIPPIPGVDRDGVFMLRTVDDADAILKRARGAKKLVLIGGGLLGLETGNGLRKRGLEISVIEQFPRLLPRQMDVPGAAILQMQMESMGFSFYLGVATEEIRAAGSGLILRLNDGRELGADMVLLSAGVRPETTLARSIGLKVGNGILVDDRMRTSADDIFAAGDTAEHQGHCYGIWPAAMEQGLAAGSNMAGQEVRYEGTVPANNLKVAGIHLFAAGDIDGQGDRETVVSRDDRAYIYRKLILRNNTIIGAILLGDIQGSEEIQKAIKSGKDISSFGKDIVDGRFDFSRLH